ncbi:hypothetical protein FG386_000361 [Cryptosporidium ryanae]|uniref:uncharacterized protein n=1 Tax=Cryptosporidium ryanae TaxID=515981 RepID=UPI003519FA6B|nr:hypothetical protein FG386_000361 [Cryptosporidium ryanae]
MNPQVKTDFPEVEAETLLILQEVISTEGYGKGETAYFGNEFTSNKSCVQEPQLDLMRSGSEGDIFSDIETPSKGNLKNRRNRSFERSITPPNLDGFLDEVYGFDNQDTVGSHEEEITVVENAGEYIDHKVENANHLSTAEYLSKLGKKKGLGRRGLERNKIDYSLFSRQRYNNHQSSSNTKVGDSGKSSFGFEISSSHQPYSECYLEVDGVCYLETHQDEDDEIEREIERERYKKQMKFREGDTEGNYGKHSKRQKNSEKLLNREWKSIQRIMNKDDFRSLDSIGDGI